MHVALVPGSTRARSVNAAVLRTAAAVAPPGVRTDLYEGLRGLPAFDPDDDREPLPEPVRLLRERLEAADAVLFCTPEYAGALPGSFKNLLDWLVGGGQLHGRPVAWINASSVAAPTQGADAHASLATVLRYLAADVVPDACARVPLSHGSVDADGTVHDEGARQRIADAVAALVVAAVRSADGT